MRGDYLKVLFLTIGRMESIESHALYPDLLRKFRNEGNEVYVVSPREKRTRLETELVEDNGAKLLYVRIGNLTKCGIIEKGITTLAIKYQFKKAIEKYFPNIKFDLIIYSTPPITLSGVVEFIKNRDNAKTYLLLKDIFPQNAVDIGVLTLKGPKSMLYKYFRRQEKRLYLISDYIGCMSQANLEYILKHNKDVEKRKVEVCPNSVEPIDTSVTVSMKQELRNKYDLPLNKTIFVYGGNLGKPQGIPFLLKCLENEKNNKDVFFLIVGDGTEYSKIEDYVNTSKQNNVRLMKRLPKEDYDRMVGSCDVGMIFLDYRFSIPNFPSRLLAYMQAKLPVLAVTDCSSDIGKVIEEGGFGWWCASESVNDFEKIIHKILNDNLEEKKENSYQYLLEQYTVDKSYEIIMKHF